MKKFLTMLFFAVIAVGVNAQKLKYKEVDKFSKQMKAETSTETLYSVNFMASGYIYQFEFCIKKVEDTYVMPANILLRDIEKYDEDSGVIFLLDNNETISLKTLFTGIGATSYGKGYYFSTCFNLPNDVVEKLKNHRITDVRIMYMGGHYDREIKKNKQDLVMRMLRLFDK